MEFDSVINHVMSKILFNQLTCFKYWYIQRFYVL